MRIIESSNRRELDAYLAHTPARDPAVLRQAARIVARVRDEGDRALRAYARRFDGVNALVVADRSVMRDEAAKVAPRVRRALAAAARNIRRVAARQVPKGWVAEPARGVRVEQRVIPLERVGCYVPGGRFPLPSSLLMTAIPAAEAGVKDIIAVCPRPDDTVMCAALEAGVTRLVKIGGAHAIAALAYGTRTVPGVDKIVGPGNAYVSAAKSLVSADCAIDFFAGPSEILVLSATGRAAWIAADLIAQAEHDGRARALLITPKRALAIAVLQSLSQQLESNPHAREALASSGAIIVTSSLEEAIAIAQRVAPEHAVCDTADVARRLTRAGTVFVGGLSAQACGDYATGSNHVLPTSGAARFRGGLSAADFVRVTSIQRLTREGLRTIGDTAVTLAEAEGLHGHARSIRMRLGGVA